MRLDAFLVREGYFESRTRAERAVLRGEVTVNGEVKKPSFSVSGGETIALSRSDGFVSEGGAKLQRAVERLGFDPSGGVYADLGASTGGFTDCLLRSGAKRVYAVDVGEGQLHPSLAASDRVTVMDRTNARFLKAADFPEALDGAVADVSFISLKLLADAISSIVRAGGNAVVLVKPQFECGKEALGKGGIVGSARAREEAVTGVVDCFSDRGLSVLGVAAAPVRKRKNIEYAVLFRKGGARALGTEDIRRIMREETKE